MARFEYHDLQGDLYQHRTVGWQRYHLPLTEKGIAGGTVASEYHGSAGILADSCHFAAGRQHKSQTTETGQVVDGLHRNWQLFDAVGEE